MPHAELLETGQRIRVGTTYNERHLIQQVPGSKYNGQWTVPATWASCAALRGIFGDKLTLGPELKKWAWVLREDRLDPANALRSALNVNDLDQYHMVIHQVMDAIDHIEKHGEFHLYPYQRADVAFFIINGCHLLGNEPGLGKTGVVIRSLQVLKHLGLEPFPALIGCPNSLKHTVWANEFEKWAPEFKVSIVDGGVGTRRKQLETEADVYVLNWESLRLHSRLAPYGQHELTDAEKAPKELNAMPLRTAVFDEAHRAKDPHAKQTRAAWAIAQQAEYRVAMTGTPVANHLGDLWSLLHLIDHEQFPTKTKWMERYTLQTPNFYGGTTVLGVRPDTRDELFSVIDPLIRRVPKSAALPQLPPKLPVQYRETPMTPKQAKAYRQMEQLMIARLLDDELLTALDPLSQLTRLTQFAAASAVLSEPYEVTRKVKWAGDKSQLNDGKHVLNEDGTIKTVTETLQDVVLSNPSSKVDDLIDLLEEMGDAPLVVAAVSRQLVELAAERLSKEGITYGLVTGAQSPMERMHSVDRFQRGLNRVILLTLGAGAEGLTLTRADTMLFMQRSWSVIQNHQAEDRIHRIGAEHHAAIRIIEQVTPATVEERRLEVLAGKEEMIQEIIRDEETLKKLLGVKK